MWRVLAIEKLYNDTFVLCRIQVHAHCLFMAKEAQDDRRIDVIENDER